jgi:hypothetical protein
MFGGVGITTSREMMVAVLLLPLILFVSMAAF